MPAFVYPVSRVSFDLPRQIWKRKETLRVASRLFDLPLSRENEKVRPGDHSQELLTIFALDNGDCFALVQSLLKLKSALQIHVVNIGNVSSLMQPKTLLYLSWKIKPWMLCLQGSFCLNSARCYPRLILVQCV